MTDDRIFAAIDATWPAASVAALGPWVIREGQGGGQRVSAASAAGAVTAADIALAEDAMNALGQAPIFMVQGDQPELDTLLETAGYRIKDPVEVWSGSPAMVASGYERSLAAIFVDYPMPIMAEIWASGGIGPARLAVMNRAAGPKSCILARYREKAQGACFVALHEGIAMLHAVEVRAEARRNGVAERMVRAAAWWAMQEGAHCLAALTVSANAPTRAMWRKLGMEVATRYHYRVRD